MSASTASKLWRLLTPAERRRGAVLLLFMLVGMVLETLGIGLVVPTIALLSEPDYAERVPSERWFRVRCAPVAGTPGGERGGTAVPAHLPGHDRGAADGSHADGFRRQCEP